MSGSPDRGLDGKALHRLTLAGAAASLASAGALAYVLLVPAGDETLAPPDAGARETVAPTVTAYRTFDELMGPRPRDLFAYGSGFQSSGARPFAVAKPVAEELPESPPPPAPPPRPAPVRPIDLAELALLSAWPEPEGGIAWVKDKDQMRTLAVGDVLREARVARIEAGAVVLVRGAETARLVSRSTIPPLVMKPFLADAGGPTVRVTPQAEGAGSAPGGPAAERVAPRARRSLGVSVQDVTSLEAAGMEMPKESRVRVRSVQRSTDDIHPGDFILAVTGERVRTTAQALERLLAAQEQEAVAVRVWRAGVELDLLLPWRE